MISKYSGNNFRVEKGVKDHLSIVIGHWEIKMERVIGLSLPPNDQWLPLFQMTNDFSTSVFGLPAFPNDN